MDNLLFYDIEVTAFDSLVVFLNRNKEEVAHFWNNRDRKTTDDPSGFEDIPDLIRDKTLVGYNNYSSFSRRFSTQIGVSPKQYQLSNRVG